MDAAPATITAALSMHAGHISRSSEFLIRLVDQPANGDLL